MGATGVVDGVTTGGGTGSNGKGIAKGTVCAVVGMEDAIIVGVIDIAMV